MLSRMLEYQLHQAVDHGLFVDDEGWRASRAHFDFIPAPIRPLVRVLVRRQARGELYVRGLGRHAVHEMAALIAEDLDTVIAVLGDTPFLFGDRPCTADCTLHGFLAILLGAPFEWWGRDLVRARPTLVAHTERMTQRFWRQDSALAVA